MDQLSFDIEVVTTWLAKSNLVGALAPDVLKSLMGFTSILGAFPKDRKPQDVVMLEKVILALVTVFVTAQNKQMVSLSKDVQSQFERLGLMPEMGTSGGDQEGEKANPVVAGPEAQES